jgi:hypothetical protein
MARVRRYMGRVEVWLDRRERAAVLATVEALTRGEAGGRWLGHRAYDDPELDREYQRLTAPELDTLHAADIAAVRDDLARDEDRCRLDDERALTWLRALERLRLVAGSRLGIEDESWETDLDAVTARRDEVAMLHDLGWLQEGIVEALEA